MASESITPTFSVSDAVALFNQMLETATPTITVVGEIANFKVSQGKWVFFDIKDDECSLSCFMSVFSLRIAIEDGMQVAVMARPNITKWGKFSLTVQTIQPVGEGSIKRAFELLRAKLAKEGLFALERKRPLPELPQKIGVISSIDAAGYQDFIKILGERFGGLEILVAPVQVQGQGAAEQIIAALKYFNETGSSADAKDSGSRDRLFGRQKAERSFPVTTGETSVSSEQNPEQAARGVEAICILRGGGSRDDLIAFDDEKLVRAIAASRVPVLTGIGHEIDTTLADLAADVRASTPSNAAEILVPDRREIIVQVNLRLRNLLDLTTRKLGRLEENIQQNLRDVLIQIETICVRNEQKFKLLSTTLATLNPREILRRGYAIVRTENGQILCTKPRISDKIVIENLKFLIESEVTNVYEKT